MEPFWKGAAVVLLTAVLGTVLDRQQRDLSALLSICGCVLVGMVTMSYLAPVVEFLRELENIGSLPQEILGKLLKAAGIGIGTELMAQICQDAGKGSLGKALQFLGAAAVLSLTVPLMSELIAMIRQILGGV